MPYLKRSSNILADIGLKLYGKKPSRKEVIKLLKIRGIKNQFAGGFLNRILFLPEYKVAKSKVKNHKIRSSSEKRLQWDIKTRLTLLAVSIIQRHYNRRLRGKRAEGHDTP